MKIRKIKRELLRLARQPWQLAEDCATFLFGRVYHDRFLAKERRIWPGTQALGDAVAVYVIYPTKGLQATHLRALRYLASKSCSAIVVSNLPLSEAERATIKPLCHVLIERPNFGYDFGGYRDGVLFALDQGQSYKRLFLLNDSTWFPITETADWIADVDRLDLDFTGAASNLGLPRPDAEDFRDMDFAYSSEHRRFHYCSFALAIGARILADPGFRKFWQGFPLTNKKMATVRRGEVGLTAWVLKRGYSHGATIDVAGLDAALSGLPDDRLNAVLRHLIIPEDEIMAGVVDAHIPLTETMPRQDRINLILTAVGRKGLSYATAYYNIFEVDFAFLKKSPIWLRPQARDMTLTILRALDTPAAREALDEIGR